MNIDTPWPLIVYPSGRSKPWYIVDELYPVDSPICRSRRTMTVNLGKSLISQGSELAFAFVSESKKFNQTGSFTVSYRSRCEVSPIHSSGIELGFPSLQGQMKQALLKPTVYESLRSISTIQRSPSVFFSIQSITSLNCILELTFTKSSLGIEIKLNEFDSFDSFVGLTYRVPGGRDAVITVGVSRNDTELEFNYRVVNCSISPGSYNATSSRVGIGSWNQAVRELKVAEQPGQWTMVNFSFPFRGSRQLAVWYFPKQQLASNASLVLDLEVIQGLTGSLPYGYDALFHRAFDDKFIPQTQKVAIDVSAYDLAAERFQIVFRYRFLPTDVRIINVSGSEWSSISLAGNNATESRVIFRSAIASCGVEMNQTRAQFQLGSSRGPFQSFSLCDGLSNWTVTRENSCEVSASNKFPNYIESIGPELVLKLPPKASEVEWLYRMVCAVPLPVDFENRKQRTKWRTVELVESQAMVVLPVPPQNGNEDCKVQLTTVGTIINEDQDDDYYFHSQPDESPNIRIVCPSQKYVHLMRRRDTFDSSCSGPLLVQYSLSLFRKARPTLRGEFVYRIHCGSDLIPDNDVAPFPKNMGLTVQVVDKWKKSEAVFRHDAHDLYEPPSENSKCRVELSFVGWDAANVAVFEDFTTNRDLYMDNLMFAHESYKPFKKMRYVSCNPRVFVNFPYASAMKGGRYRQMCSNGPKEPCHRELNASPVLDKWRTLAVDADMNWNQMRESRYTIENPFMLNGTNMIGSDSIVLEVEFTSIATRSWLGRVHGRGSSNLIASSNGVTINGNPGIVGKQYFFRSSATIRIDPMNLNNKDHIFKLRYRLVQWKKARRERDLGEVLIATSKVKQLRFDIPNQFFMQNAKQNWNTQLQWDDDYLEGGSFPVWMFKHHYTFNRKIPSVEWFSTSQKWLLEMDT